MSPYNQLSISEEHQLQPWTDCDPWSPPTSPKRSSTAASPNNRRYSRTTTKGTTQPCSTQLCNPQLLEPDEIHRKFQSYRKLLAVREQAQSNYFEFPFLSFRSNSLQEKRSLTTLAGNFPLKIRLGRLPMKIQLSRKKFNGI